MPLAVMAKICNELKLQRHLQGLLKCHVAVVCSGGINAQRSCTALGHQTLGAKVTCEASGAHLHRRDNEAYAAQAADQRQREDHQAQRYAKLQSIQPFTHQNGRDWSSNVCVKVLIALGIIFIESTSSSSEQAL
jgi:hypothetical protein